MEGLAGSVLDASALLAYLQGETGHQTVQAALIAGAVMNIVNYAEVLSRLADGGEDPQAAHRRLSDEGLIGALLGLVPVTEDDAITIGRLRPATRRQGLSLGDRACLATGIRLARPVLTADRIWATIGGEPAVRVIR